MWKARIEEGQTEEEVSVDASRRFPPLTSRTTAIVYICKKGELDLPRLLNNFDIPFALI
jgi:hypothetical protein